MARGSARIWALRTVFRTVGPVAPGLAARWAETIFCTPPSHRPRADDDGFLARGRRSTIPWAGGHLAVWEWGSGPTVVIAHGWGSRAGRFRIMTDALVGAGFRVVGYDGPAHGASTGRIASLPEFARALREVGRAAGPLHGLVGHSLGGAAVAMAMRDGLKAGRVVLLAAPADVRVFSDMFAESLAIPRRVHQRMQGNLQDRLRMRWEDLHIPTLVRELGGAAMVVHDRDDADVPFEHGERIVDAWAGAHLVPTSGLGHRGILRDPEVVRRAVEFMREDGAG